MKSRLVHPQLMRSLRVAFNKYADIADPHRTTDPYGQEIITYTPATDLNLHAIPCYVEPASGAETRRPTDTVDVVTYIIALAGYYPQIVVAQAAIVGDKTYNITKIAHDDSETQTYLTVEIVNPNAQ